MVRFLSFAAVLGLAISLAACAGPSKSTEGCCAMSAGGCKAEGKPMACEKKEKAAGCCSKSGADGKPAAEHQH